MSKIDNYVADGYSAVTTGKSLPVENEYGFLSGVNGELYKDFGSADIFFQGIFLTDEWVGNPLDLRYNPATGERLRVRLEERQTDIQLSYLDAGTLKNTGEKRISADNNPENAYNIKTIKRDAFLGIVRLTN